INAMTLANGLWLGADVSTLVDWFVEHTMDEGGWNCEWQNGSRRASFHSTLNALRALHEHERLTGGTAATREAQRAGEEYPARRPSRPADAGSRADGAGRPAGRRDLAAAARAAGRGLVRDRRGRGPALALADDAGAARAAVVERGLSTHSITFRSRGPPWRCGVRAAGARAVRLQGITGAPRHMRHLCHDAVTPAASSSSSGGPRVRCRLHPPTTRRASLHGGRARAADR